MSVIVSVVSLKQTVLVCEGERVSMLNEDDMQMMGTVMQANEGGVRVLFETGHERLYSINEFAVFCYDIWENQ